MVCCCMVFVVEKKKKKVAHEGMERDSRSQAEFANLYVEEFHASRAIHNVETHNSSAPSAR